MTIGLQLKHDAPCRAGLTQAIDHILILLLCCCSGSAILCADRTVCTVDRARTCLKSNLIDVLIETLLLHATR